MDTGISSREESSLNLYLGYDYLPARQLAEMLAHLARMYDRASGRWQRPREAADELRVKSINTGSSVLIVAGGIFVGVMSWAIRNVGRAYRDAGEGFRAFAEGNAAALRMDAEIERTQAETRNLDANTRRLEAEASAARLHDEAPRLEFHEWARLLLAAEEDMKGATRRLNAALSAGDREVMQQELNAIERTRSLLHDQARRLGLPRGSAADSRVDMLNAIIREAHNFIEALRQASNITEATVDHERVVGGEVVA